MLRKTVKVFNCLLVYSRKLCIVILLFLNNLDKKWVISMKLKMKYLNKNVLNKVELRHDL